MIIMSRALLLLALALAGCTHWTPLTPRTEAQLAEDLNTCRRASTLPTNGGLGAAGGAATISAEWLQARWLQRCMADRGYTSSLSWRPQP